MIPTKKQLHDAEVLLERDFAEVKAHVLKAVESCPKTVTLEQAMEQIKRFEAIRGKI